MRVFDQELKLMYQQLTGVPKEGFSDVEKALCYHLKGLEIELDAYHLE